jgi:homoserine kinase
MNEVTVRIPATSANLGPGYDCLGVALRLHNDVSVRRGKARGSSRMAMEAGRRFFAAAKARTFRFDWRIEGDVPRSRGLGSSVTVRLGILHALNELSGRPLNRMQLFQLCSELEGHPDNAAPAEFGGFTAAGTDGGVSRFEVLPELKFVLLIPEFEIATSEARRVLPSNIAHSHAAASAANACRITAAFASQNYELLRGSFVDYLHQPHRLRLIPFLKTVILAGENAGALGGFLSGSGSTIACVTLRDAEAVAAAMLAASRQRKARTIITAADNRGAQVLRD